MKREWVPILGYMNGEHWALLVGGVSRGRVLRVCGRYEAYQWWTNGGGMRVFRSMREAAKWLLTFA